MQTMRIVLSFSLLSLAACADGSITDPGGNGSLPPPTPGHAYLTIVGDPNVFLEAGAVQEITVKYADDAGDPLAGQIAFHVDGDGLGSSLSGASGVTDAQGLVTIQITGGSAETAFHVLADAEYATAVTWNVAVAVQAPPTSLSYAGSYDVESQFDLTSGLPGTAGTVINTILDMTDGPNDPATWLIDEALTAIDSGTISTVVDATRPAVDSYLNDVLLSYAPGFFTSFISVSNDVGQVARKFGLKSQLVIQELPDHSLVATHTITGVVYTIDGMRYDYTMADLGLPTPSASNIALSIDPTGRLAVADHTLPISYGHLILFALDNIVIPAIDPYSHNLNELLNGMVDCYAVGQDVSDYVGIGSPGLYTSGCQTALSAAADLIESQILGIDGTGAAFTMHGDAKPLDTNGDRTVDKLTGGLWEGQMSFGPLTSTLAKPDQKFLANRSQP